MSRPANTCLWSLPGQSSIARVHNQLQAMPGLVMVERHNSCILFLDTVDWRLYRKGWSLQASSQGEQWRLALNEVASGKLLAVSPSAALPGFSSDMPPGILRKKLSKPVHPRALLTVCELRLKRHEYAYLDNEGKLYFRLFLDQAHAYQAEQAQSKKLPNCVLVEPVRGYEKQTLKFVNSLVEQFELQEQGASLLSHCLVAWDIEPGLKASRRDIALYHDEPTYLGLRRIFLSLLETMRANETGLIEQIDTEFLHDYRVAVRRTRSLLGQSKKVIAPDKLQEFEDDFAWLGALTGPARDYDVMLLEFSDYQALLSDYNAAEFIALENYLLAERENAYQTLIATLKSERYKKFKEKWRSFLDNNDLMFWEAGAQQMISEFANQRISHVYKRVIKEGRSIAPESTVEIYHQLRKSCKKLRYLLEMLRDLYEPKIVKKSIKALKQLQDNLGELQDLEVHTEILRNFLLQQKPAHTGDQITGNTIQQLIDRMYSRKQVVIGNFHKTFRVFCTRKNKHLMTELLETEQRRD